MAKSKKPPEGPAPGSTDAASDPSVRSRLASVPDPVALLEGLFTRSPIAYALFSADGFCFLTNPAYRQLFGRAPPPQYNVLQDDEAERLGLLGPIRRAFAGETVTTPTVWYDPTQLKQVDGSGARRVAISCTFFPLCEPSGAVSHVAIAYKDVTAEVSAAQAAARERDLLRAIIDQSSDGIVVADSEGVIRILNAAAQRQHGLPLREVPPDQWVATYGLRDLEGNPLQLEQVPLYRALHGEEVSASRWKVVRTDGEVRVLEGSTAPLRSASGGPGGAVLVARDITDRQRLESALAASEDEFRTMFEVAGVGMALGDPESKRFARVNRRLCELTGYSEEELLQRTPQELTHPDDVEQDHQEYLRMLRGETSTYANEKRYLRKDGSVVWVQVTATLMRAGGGRPARTIGVVRDITSEVEARSALAAAQRTLTAITDNATVGLLMMDERQHCVFMNPAAERIIGFTLQQVQGRPLHDVIHHTRPDGTPYPMAECPIDRALPTRAQEQGEDVFVRPDGSFYPAAFTASPIIAGGHALGTVIELRETAAEKRREQEREQLLLDLRDAVRLRDEFLSIASHELKTPLTPLTLKLDRFARRIEAETASPLAPYVGDVRSMRRQIKRLAELVDDLLDISHLTAGQFTLHPEEVDVRALVEDVVSRFEPEAERAGSQLRLDAGESVTAWWDRLRMEQVLSNLLSNAIKYGAGAPVDVTVEVHDEQVRLTVRDRGIGLTAEAMDKLFQKFGRGVSERHYGGLGLGLFVSRQIVEAFDGTIGAHSNGRDGATFEVEVPLRLPERPAKG